MNHEIDYRRLQSYHIDLPPEDPRTLFPGDTAFHQEAITSQYGDNGGCHVTKVVRTFSGHAGTHADQPVHVGNKTSEPFSVDHYSGRAFVLDVSKRLRKDLIVTRAMIQDELAYERKRRERDGELDIECEALERTLICTNGGQSRPTPSSRIAREEEKKLQTSPFPYLTRDAAQFFVEHRKKHDKPAQYGEYDPHHNVFCLIGIDSPSVERPNEKELAEGVHGILFNARIAIVENIAFGGRTYFANNSIHHPDKSIHRPGDHSQEGELITIFDPSRDFPDAKGIESMLFIPGREKKLYE